MKKIILLLIVLTVILMVFFLAGCVQDPTMSIKDRIGEFVSDLNDSNRDGIFKDHFHPDSTSFNNGDEEAIDTYFPNGGTYTLVSISGSGSTRTVEIGGSGEYTCTFTMKEDGTDDWYILSISGDATYN